MICNNGTDTVRYLVAGYADFAAKLKQHYTNLGYVCIEDSFTFASSSLVDKVNKNDVKYYESQGFTCYEYNY